MKALIDAAAQVSGGPSIPFPLPAAALGFTNIMVQANNNQGGPLRKRDHESALSMKSAVTASGAKKAKPDKSSIQEDESKRVKRLEQNRTAAIESRRRKKHMVEELQRSIQYFSRANSALKSQNAELERQLLLAKHKILAKGSSGEVAASTVTTKVTLPNATPRDEFINAKEPLKETTETVAKLLPVGGITSSFLSSAPPNKELEEQARQAQFAATQALYKSMGYPAGAARIAANTFSQFVSQTGIAPGISASAAVATSRESVPPSKRNSINSSSSGNTLPYATSSLPLNLADLKPSTRVESECDPYIEALNQFAMQQAAAANAAAAAATAAIQAVNIHNQLKHSGAAFSSSSSSSIAPSFSFSIPNTDMKSWPFQNASPFSTKE